MKAIRLKWGISQDSIAFKLGISQQGYGKIERGLCDIKLSQLIQIVSILEVSILDIFTEDIQWSDNQVYKSGGDKRYLTMINSLLETAF
ncbi:MAG: helix-turn-helix transcriptional regulator [Runella sp.]